MPSSNPDMNLDSKLTRLQKREQSDRLCQMATSPNSQFDVNKYMNQRASDLCTSKQNVGITDNNRTKEH